MKSLKEQLKRGLTDIKEGRVYKFNCRTRGKSLVCADTAVKISLCYLCAVRQAKRWYKIGLKEGMKKRSDNKP